MNEEHVRALAATEDDLPPILVQESSMRIIDGMHRVRAAKLRGDSQVRVRLFDGDDAAAFVAAVETNVAHGLPLSLADREAAAGRIVRLFPDWSNRAVAKVSGLSDKTIGAIRNRSAGDSSSSDRRLGQDGRVRPLNSADARRRAKEMLDADPHASLRSVARVVGLSPTTVRDVREKMRQDIEPVPQRTREIAEVPHQVGSHGPGQSELARLRALKSLKKDPSLKFNDAGRELLRWLELHAKLPEKSNRLISRIPPHCIELVLLVALDCSAWWTSLAHQLELERPQT